jgi:hypothetical protein
MDYNDNNQFSAYQQKAQASQQSIDVSKIRSEAVLKNLLHSVNSFEKTRADYVQSLTWMNDLYANKKKQIPLQPENWQQNHQNLQQIEQIDLKLTDVQKKQDYLEENQNLVTTIVATTIRHISEDRQNIIDAIRNNTNALKYGIGGTETMEQSASRNGSWLDKVADLLGYVPAGTSEAE